MNDTTFPYPKIGYNVACGRLPVVLKEVTNMRVAFISLIILLIAGACSPTGEQGSRAAGATPMAAEPSATAEANRDLRAAARASTSIKRTASTSTMPAAILGQWRQDDLGRDPTGEDCNQSSQSNGNFGNVLNVYARGYSVFEDGGRIIDVHRRTDATIDATFDMTYADTPTQARRNFALKPNGSLVVSDDEAAGRPDVTAYLRCP